MTKREFLQTIIESNLSEEMVKFAEKEIVALDKKNEKAKSRETKAQKENNILMVYIKELLNEEPKTISKITEELQEKTECEYTNQKISALMKKIMVEDSDVEKVEVRVEKKNRVAYKRTSKN